MPLDKETAAVIIKFRSLCAQASALRKRAWEPNTPLESYDYFLAEAAKAQQETDQLWEKYDLDQYFGGDY